MRVLIAEDDKFFYTQLETFLQRFAQEKGISIHSAVFSNGAELVEKYHPEWDLLLLDVDIPGMDGFSVARSIREVDPDVAIMFITNLAQYAIRGYEVHALDYVLKPVSYPAFKMKLTRELGNILNKTDQYLMISQGGSQVRIPISKLRYVEVYNHSLRYHTVDGVIETTGSKSMKELERELQEKGFCRCHNSYLINLRFVDAVGDGKVRIKSECIPVSRNRRNSLMEALMNWIKGKE